MESLIPELVQQRVLPVAVLDRLETAVPVAQALVAGGLNTLELTLRTPVALEAIHAIRRAVPEMKVGAGTVLTPDQATAARDAGAAFALAPGLNPRVVARARELDLPFLPGVVTPTDIELALEAGCRWLKFFPAEAAGGTAMLRSLHTPFAHLGITFVPLGGITLYNLADYLALPCVGAVGGSWLVDPAVVKAGDWKELTRRAREAVTRAASCGAGLSPAAHSGNKISPA